MTTDLMQKQGLDSPDELAGNHRGQKTASAFKTISEVAELLDVPQHVLRFWESKFPQVKPMKLRGGRRYYRPEDIAILTRIKHLLYREGYTIKGAKKIFDQKLVDIKTAMKETPVEAAPLTQTAEIATPISAAKKPAQGRSSELQALLAELQELRSMLKSA